MSALLRSGYRDDPVEAERKDEPFTEQDWVMYRWADAWRLIVHRYENKLDRTPEASIARAIETIKAPNLTQYTPTNTIASLAALCNRKIS